MSDELNLPEEKKVVLNDTKNNIKVVAGPGSGKTTLIIEKIKRLVDNGVKPNKILVITYTNKAAEDLERKIQEMMPEQKGFYISTIHGFCTQFIRENSQFFQEYREFTVLDELGQFLFIVKNIQFIKTEDLPFMQNLVYALKNYFGRIKDNYSIKELESKDHIIKKAYLNYCSQLHSEKKFDFGDLINVVIKSINSNDKLKEIVNSKFEYLFIDEYQDINRTQEKLIKLFHNLNNKVMIVGDVNQSIYGFRGADVTIFQNFNTSFNKYHKVEEYKLKINFRSTENIINISNKFLNLPTDEQIIGNKDELISEITEKGVKPKLFIYEDKNQEARELSKYIKKLHTDKIIKKYSDVAILFRSVKKDAKRFMEELDNEKIKYEIMGDGSLFNLNYIIALLDCYELLAKSEDIKNDFLDINIKKESELYNKLIDSKPLSILFKLLESSNYIKKVIENNDELVMFNIAKLSEIIDQQQQMFSSKDIEKFIYGLKKLDKSFLDTEQPIHSNIDSVKIMTIHKSKGLEYPVIIMPGLTKDNYKLMNKDHIAELFSEYDESEDAKRAFYVGITRSMQLLVLSYFQNKNNYVDILQKTNLVNIEKWGHGEGLNKFLSQSEGEELKEIKTLKSKKEMLNMTYYKLIEYWRCKYAYKLRFHYNMIVPYKGELGYGSKIHTLLYHINLVLLENKNLSWEGIIEKISDKYSANMNEYKQKLMRYLSKFKIELKSIVKPEMPFHFTFNNLIITGRIDLLVKNKDGTYTMIEFKSGTYKKGIFKKKKDQLNSAKEQIELYALAIKKNYNVTKGIVFFFGDGHKEVFNIDGKHMRLELFKLIEDINDSNFEPTQDKEMCRSCVFSEYKICPHNKNKSKELKINKDFEEDCHRDCCNFLF
ncbi:ATP-dependent helicase [Candidatus Woesearchaeota archaeon]|jgi:DNA helicase II / ATP-dependent DNA helicase PcrA|nr:ATP-dependent helicase [Candidatus Woesearchaeota archaeon]MBT6519121.1 ATP-dependent helicase [Candidatus Woesearchaeota archaeon]